MSAPYIGPAATLFLQSLSNCTYCDDFWSFVFFFFTYFVFVKNIIIIFFLLNLNLNVNLKRNYVL